MILKKRKIIAKTPMNYKKEKKCDFQKDCLGQNIASIYLVNVYGS